MSTTGMITPQNAPRTIPELLQLKRGVRFRLGLQISMFADDTAEQAFLGESDQNQAQALAAALANFDAQQGGGQAPMANHQPPQMAAQPMQQQQLQIPLQQPQAPQAMPQQPTMPQQPQMPLQAPQQPQQPQMPQMPMQPAMPQMPAVQPPPAAPQQPQMQMPAQAPPPQMQQPQVAVQPPQMPQMPMQPQMPSMARPVMPTQPQMPTRQPQTASDPTNAGANGSAPQQAMGGQHAKVLQQIAGTLGENQKWIEEVQTQVAGNTLLLTVLLQTMLQLLEQQGIDPNQLVKLIKASGEQTVETFLSNFQESGEGKEG